MNYSFKNNCQFEGFCGKDTELKTFDNGGKIASVSLAVDDSYKGKDGEWVKQSDWINLKARNKLAELFEKYVKKGTGIKVQGKMKQRKWQGQGMRSPNQPRTSALPSAVSCWLHSRGRTTNAKLQLIIRQSARRRRS